MSATADHVAKLRRMVDETTAETYSDDELSVYIEAHPLLDERGETPYVWDSSTQPPTQDDNEDWIPTYDLHAAAADVWEEKAAKAAQDYDFKADGGSYNRSQVYEQFMKQARWHRSRQSLTTTPLVKWPVELGGKRISWVINQLDE